MHFEELWDKSEDFHKKFSTDDTPEEILEKIKMTISLMQTIENKTDVSENFEKAKSHLLGEILFALTNLSLKDNIKMIKNLFETLGFILPFDSFKREDRNKYSIKLSGLYSHKDIRSFPFDPYILTVNIGFVPVNTKVLALNKLLGKFSLLNK